MSQILQLAGIFLSTITVISVELGQVLTQKFKKSNNFSELHDFFTKLIHFVT